MDKNFDFYEMLKIDTSQCIYINITMIAEPFYRAIIRIKDICGTQQSYLLLKLKIPLIYLMVSLIGMKPNRIKD